jgi:hypothetical protein
MPCCPLAQLAGEVFGHILPAARGPAVLDFRLVAWIFNCCSREQLVVLRGAGLQLIGSPHGASSLRKLRLSDYSSGPQRSLGRIAQLPTIHKPWRWRVELWR